MNATLKRSAKSNLSHEYRWFVLGDQSNGHEPLFSPPQAGDSGMEECLAWLESQGYKQVGAPEDFAYSR